MLQARCMWQAQCSFSLGRATASVAASHTCRESCVERFFGVRLSRSKCCDGPVSASAQAFVALVAGLSSEYTSALRGDS